MPLCSDSYLLKQIPQLQILFSSFYFSFVTHEMNNLVHTKLMIT